MGNYGVTMRVFFAFFLVSCAEPFAFDRHHLQDIRILEANVQDGVADAVIWSGEGPFHSYSPILRWHVEDVLVAEGFGVAVPEADVYQLEVESEAGDILYADVVSGYALDELSITRMRWTEDSISDFSLASRNNVSLVDEELVEGSVSRLLVEGRAEEARLRWSSDAGSILETSIDSTDVFRDHLIFKEGELVGREEGKQDTIHVFLLAIDGSGGSVYKWIDLQYNALIEPKYLDEKIVALPSDLQGLVQVDIVRTADGYSFENVISVEEAPQDIPHPCMESVLMNLDWIRSGRCALTDIDGISVVLELQ